LLNRRQKPGIGLIVFHTGTFSIFDHQITYSADTANHGQGNLDTLERLSSQFITNPVDKNSTQGKI